MKLALLCSLAVIPGFARAVDYATLPLAFEPNMGQAGPQVRFVARAPGVSVLLTDTEALLTSGQTSNVRMKLVGASKPRAAAGVGRLPGSSNYMHGNDPSGWHTGIPTFAQVRYRGVYRGIDLLYYGNHGRLEYDFVVAPGADPRVIQLGFEGVRSLRIEANGDLTAVTPAGELRFQKPGIYQQVGHGRRPVDGRYVLLSDRRVGFTIGRYDRNRPLVIDPTLLYSGFLAGGATGRAIAVDAAGNTYVAGFTNSSSFPVVGGLTGSHPFSTASNEVFVAKITPDGSTLVYSTCFGGDGSDQANGIAVDSTGNVYVAGTTSSANFPLVNAAQNAYGGATDAFVAKLNPQGNALLFSTYLGGSGNDAANGIALDKSSGNLWVIGTTLSTNFPIQSAYQSTNKGGRDVFVARYSSNGAQQLSTYVGGSQDDYGQAIAVDGSGNVYLTGYTFSSNFPNTVSAPKPAGSPWVFASKLSADGSIMAYSNWIGGGCGSNGYGIAVDSSGAAYIAGDTCAVDFPVTSKAAQLYKGQGQAGFALKLSPGGNQLVYSTFVGGSRGNHSAAIAVDSAGNAYLTGYTISSDFPTNNALELDREWMTDILFRSTDGGVTWSDLDHNSFQAAAMWAISVDPRNSNTIVIAETGINRTTDGGATWNHTNTWDILNDLKRSPSNPDILYGASSSGLIYKSTDAGVTWQTTGSTPGTVDVLAVHPTDPTMLAAGTSSSGFYTSTNSGAAWTARNNGLGSLAINDIGTGSDPNTFYLATTNGVYKTTDGANTWSALQNGLPPAVAAIVMVQDSVNAGTVYTLVNGVIYKTTDAGATWAASVNGIAGSVLDFGIAPSNPSVLYALTGTGVYRSSDGGASWIVTLQGQLFGVEAVVVDPHNPNTVYAGLGNSNDVFVTKISADGSAFTYSTYLGGPNADSGNAIALDGSGNAYITGSGSTMFPTTYNAFLPDVGGAFVAKISDSTAACVYTIKAGTSTADPSFFTSAGGEGQFVVIAPSGCSWQVTSNASWIQIPNRQSGGTGIGPVWIEVSQNTGAARQATVTIDSQPILIKQAAGGCSYALSAYGMTMPAAGGSLSVSVTAGAGCDWEATPGAGWISAANLGGAGNGSFLVIVQPNPYATMRWGNVSVGGQTLAVSQAGASASFSFNPPSASPASGPSASSVAVTTTLTSATWRAVSTQPWLVVTSGPSFVGNAAVSYAVAANPGGATRTAQIIVGADAFTVTQAGSGTPGYGFYPVTPCRVADTRGNGKSGAFGPPSISGGTSRAFPIPTSGCGVPTTAVAYSLNVTVVPPGQLIYLTMWPAGQSMPTASTLNDFSTQVATPGNVVANAAIVPAGANGSVSVYVSDTSDVIIDVNGYFAPPGTGGLSFYPLAPCRVADTRGNGKTGAFGSPSMAAGSNRSFPIPQSGCNVPATAQAYSLNMTVVPPGQLTYLTTWPSGQSMPTASTLNDFSIGIPAQAMGKVVANAAIVPAGTNGAVSVFVSDATDVIIDINGYFGPPGAPGALAFYATTPCRVVDTRGNGMTGPFGPPIMAANATRTFPIPQSSCSVPTAAQAYSLNMTVVPPSQLTYLTTWPSGQTMPTVSTLNDFSTVNTIPGRVVANAAIVPSGTSGSVSVFASDATDVIIDINGYFAP